MRKKFPIILAAGFGFAALFFLSSIFSAAVWAYPGCLNSILPPGAVYDEGLSQHSMQLSGSLTVFDRDDKEVRIISERHVFVTDMSFLEAKAWLGKKVRMNSPDKTDLLNQLNEKGIGNKNRMSSLLKDSRYASAHGFINNWIVHVYSVYHDPVTKEEINRTVIVFTNHPFQPSLIRKATGAPVDVNK